MVEVYPWNLLARVHSERDQDQPVLDRLMMDTAQELLSPSWLASEQVHSLQQAAFKAIETLATEQQKSPIEILAEVSKKSDADPIAVMALYQEKYGTRNLSEYQDKNAGLQDFAKCAAVIILTRKVKNNAGPALLAVISHMEAHNTPQQPQNPKRR